MKFIRFILFVAATVTLGVYRARKGSTELWDSRSIGLMAAIIAVWQLISIGLFRFVDLTNRAMRLLGFAGFSVLVASMFAVGRLAFVLKRSVSGERDFALSFQNDLFTWLFLLPLLFYYNHSRTRANLSVEPSAGSVTSCAD